MLSLLAQLDGNTMSYGAFGASVLPLVYLLLKACWEHAENLKRDNDVLRRQRRVALDKVSTLLRKAREATSSHAVLRGPRAGLIANLQDIHKRLAALCQSLADGKATGAVESLNTMLEEIEERVGAGGGASIPGDPGKIDELCKMLEGLVTKLRKEETATDEARISEIAKDMRSLLKELKTLTKSD